MSVDFRILGPVEVELGDGVIARVPGGRAQELLCLLLVQRGEVVSHERIVDALWEAAPPANARNAVQVVVSRLRSAVGADAIQGRAGGYAVIVAPQRLDADRFERLLGRGLAELGHDQPVEAAATLRAALRLWRGPALADVSGRRFAQPEIVRLEALHLHCRAEAIAAELAAGAGADAVGELEALVLEHPLDERLRELLMRALYQAGRQADALAAYRAARRALLDGLGLEPGPALRTLEAEMLRQDVPVPAAAVAAVSDDQADRRQVTCLVARVVTGAPGADLDPEALQRMVGGYHELAEASLGRHGGALVERRGDGILAVFGLPVVHEDDALRAARVGLELEQAAATLGPGVGSAAGICSGVVVMAADGAAGPPVGRPVAAAEALSLAHREVRLDERTWRLVEHAATGAPAGDGYRIDGLIAGAPAIRRSLERPLVGRAVELAALRAARDRAEQERSWVLAVVLGEAGIGKTRLAAAFRSELAPAAVFEGRCPAYGAATYRPLREVVVQACAGRPLDELAEVLGIEPEAAAGVVRAVGLAAGPVGEEGPWAFGRFFGALAVDAPVVVIVDDVHWAEPGLLDLLREIVRRAAPGPGLLVCLSRPELMEAEPGWPRGIERSVTIQLAPLSQSQSAALLDELASGASDGEVRDRIVRTAAGNPLFLEQLATYLGEQRGEDELPPAIRGLLAARLDALEPAERAVLCYGSIGGEEFDLAGLHALAEGAPLAEFEQACEALVRRDLIESGPVFRFRHALIRDVAYGTLSKAARARLHERFADQLTAREGDAPGAALRVAFQLEAAERCAREIGSPQAGALVVRARQALAEAAAVAHRGGDLRAEVGLLERAIRLGEEPDAERVELLPVLAAALFDVGTFARAEEVAGEAVRMGAELDMPGPHARGLVERERLAVYQQQATLDVAASLAVADEALERLSDLADDVGMARAHYLRCELLWMGGDPDAGYASAERMLQAAGRAGSGFEASAAVGYMAWSLVQGETPVEKGLERSQELARRFERDRIASLQIAGFRAVLVAMQGRFEQARQEMRAARVGLQELGLSQASTSMALFDAQLELLAGNAAGAVSAVGDAGRLSDETGDRWFQATVRVDRANALLRQGAAEAARAVAEIDAVPAPADAEWALKRLCARALLAASTGEADLAVSEARAAAAAADSTKLLTFRADAHRVLAEVLGPAGERDAAGAAAAEALRLYRAKQNSAGERALLELAVMR